MDPKNIYRWANLLVQQHGVDAKFQAMQRVLDLREAGDKEGARVWLLVFEAVLELQLVKPHEGQKLH